MDDNTVKVILALFGLIQVIGLAVVGIYSARASGSADTAKKLGKSNSNKLDELKTTGDATHTLVNSNMGESLNVGAVALRRIADMTGKDEDVKRANAAQAKYDDHVAKQATVDESLKQP